MKDIPGIFWILLLTFVAGSGILLYSRLGPSAVPQAHSAWEHVEAFRQDVEYRRGTLAVGATRENVAPPYRVVARRLSDAEVPTRSARYILRIRLLDEYKMLNQWLQGGLEVGLVDLKPGNVLGSVRLVTARRIEDKQ